MDFNPLDLLASTALRDNRATQPDTTTCADLKLLQPDDADAEDEEDETDGNGDDHTRTVINGDVMPCSGCEVEDNTIMGSVKTGKDKGLLGKPVVTGAEENVSGKRVQADEEKMSGNFAIIDQTEKYLVKIRTLEEAETDGEEDAASDHLQEPEKICKGEGGGLSAEHESEVTLVNGKVSPVPCPAFGVPTSQRAIGCEDSAENAVDKRLEKENEVSPAVDKKVEHAIDADSDTHSCQTEDIFGTGEGVASDSEAQDENFDSGCLSSEAQTPEGIVQDGDTSSQSDSKVVTSLDSSENNIDQDLKMTVGLCNNCDEKGTLPVTPLPLVAADTELREKTHSASDQEFSDISGNKEIHPSTNCLDINSPPPLPLPSSPANVSSFSSVLLDHCYTAFPGKPAHRASADLAEDSGDAFESADENGSADDIERRPRSLSVDSEYLHGVSGTSHELENIPQADKASLMSPTPSVDSVSNDSSVSESSNALGQVYSILLPGCQNQALFQNSAKRMAVGGAVSPALDQVPGESTKFYNPSPLDGSGCPGPAPKCGKFRIGTFASFSSSNLELDRETVGCGELKDRRLKIGIPSELGMKSSLSSPALISPGSPFPLLQSPGIEWDRSDAGSEIQDDLDSSTTDDKYLSSSHGSDMSGITSVVWNHPVFHDHDYCCKETSERVFGKPVAEVRPMKVGKRKYTKRKNREVDEEKINKKGKYLKRELLKQDNRFSLPGSFDSKTLALRSPMQSDPPSTRPVGRPRKRLDRQMDSDIDPETGAKMKITGKFQDQYVYYLSKTSRNRRRKVPDGPVDLPADRIILPAPKPGDIVVPHLSDADIEAIKHGGRAALKRSTSANFALSQLPPPQQDHADMDSNIVNTILSMESDNLGSPLPAQTSDISDTMGLYEEQPVADGLGFMGENMNLTPDQVDLLLSVVKDVEVPSYNPLDHGDSKLATSQALDFLTSGDTVHMGSPALDSMAATTLDKDILQSDLSSSNSQISSGTASQDEKVVSETVKSETDVVSGIKQEKILSDTQRTVFNRDMPHASMPVPSFDKTLEFLKGDFKPELFPESSVTQSVENMATADNDTPWIVTVTIYWNDIPAIIINNLPYVRLVDIHKQILPAKDTGILKKRCQLMSIPVLNCSDMQRYFLVQYGRAYNSKSTLVITKDQARELIAYYVDPQPRGLRADIDGSSGGSLKRSSSCVELGSIADSSVHPHPPSFASPRRRGGFRRRITPSHSLNPSPGPASPIPAAVAEQPPLLMSAAAVPDSPSKRLRHKKINFLEMLKGEDSASSSPATPSAESSRSEESLGDICALDQVLPRVSSKATNGHKRRHSKEMSPESLSGRRGSKAGVPKEHRKSGEGKTSPTKGVERQRVPSQDGAVMKEEADITVVVDAHVDNVKIKKRSPGLSSAASTSPPNRPKSAKFGPLKVKLKGLLNFGSTKTKQPKKKNLFGRKAPGKVSVQTGARTVRVLKVAHQDADVSALGETAMSQVAEVHLDLYKRRMSPCVKCWTCEKFLSVPGFLQHQHPHAGSQALVDVTQLQVLVPMNKENISLEEKRLWNEFVGLQKRLDRSPLTACSMTPRQPLQPHPLTPPEHVMVLVGGEGCNVEATPPEESGLTESAGFFYQGESSDQESGLADTHISVTSPVADDIGRNSGGELTVVVDAQVNSAQPKSHLQPASIPLTHTRHEEKPAAGSAGERGTAPPPSLHRPRHPAKRQHHRAAAPVHVRTSSRKRKEKQFFSIENYSFSRKSAKLDAEVVRETGAEGEENPGHGTNVVTLCNGPELTSFTSMQDIP